MTITMSRITAAAAVCTTAAGAIFIGVQVNHPPADVEHIVTTQMAVRETAKVVMAVLALAGVTGMFLRNRSRFGVLGLVGYLLLSVGYLAMFATECIVGYVLPVVARTDPGYAQAVIDAAIGHTPQRGIGHVQDLLMTMGMGYAFGGLLFGIALFRAGILARWACLLLAYGTTSALALSALPDSFNRPFAVPVGVALVGLGVSLWRHRDEAAHEDAPTTPVLEPAVR
jgi:hypothetical protein